MTFCKKQNCRNGEQIKGQEWKTELPTKGQKGVQGGDKTALYLDCGCKSPDTKHLLKFRLFYHKVNITISQLKN